MNNYTTKAFLFKALENFINFPGELPVLVGHLVAGIMGAERKINRIVDIVPVGVVLQFFCFEGDLGHKAERLGEVLEFEGCFQFVVRFFPHDCIILGTFIKPAASRS